MLYQFGVTFSRFHVNDHANTAEGKKRNDNAKECISLGECNAANENNGGGRGEYLSKNS